MFVTIVSWEYIAPLTRLVTSTFSRRSDTFWEIRSLLSSISFPSEISFVNRTKLLDGVISICLLGIRLYPCFTLFKGRSMMESCHISSSIVWLLSRIYFDTKFFTDFVLMRWSAKSRKRIELHGSEWEDFK